MVVGWGKKLECPLELVEHRIPTPARCGLGKVQEAGKKRGVRKRRSKVAVVVGLFEGGGGGGVVSRFDVKYGVSDE